MTLSPDRPSVLRLLVPLLLCILCGAGCAWGQKKVTPVDDDPGRPQQPVLHYYDKHGNKLAEPVYFLTDLDTVRNVRPGPVYPLLNGIDAGVDFFDGIMLLAGQSYSSFSAAARLSLHNWLFPAVEAGFGRADSRPDAGNFHYVCRPSPFVRIGMDYNFLYKSDPAYQVFVGFRAGWSSFRYDISDITISSGYWDETDRFALPRQSATVLWGELLAGIKVRIAGPFAMGWSFRWHRRLHTRPGEQSEPWFVPGYGGSAPVTGTFSLYWTFPLSKSKRTDDIPEIQ